MTLEPDGLKKTRLDHAVDIVSATLQTLPWTGGLAKYLEEYYPSQQKRLIGHLCSCLTEQAKNIEYVKCNVDKLGVLVTNVLIESARTTSEKKRAAFRAIVLNYASGKVIDENRLEYFTNLLASLTELQICILKVARDLMAVIKDYSLTKPNATIESTTIDDVISASIPELSFPAYNDLVSKGLLKHTTWRVEKPDPKSMPLKRVELSELGKEFLAWIVVPDEHLH